MGVPGFAILFLVFLFSSFGASGECYPHGSWELAIVMIVIDTSLSVCFLILFVTPIIELRRALSNGSDFDSVQTTAFAGDDKIAILLRDNVVVCLVCVTFGFIAISYMALCQAFASPLGYYSYILASFAALANNIGIVYLMRKKRRNNVSARLTPPTPKRKMTVTPTVR
jgi:hypothetical protein